MEKFNDSCHSSRSGDIWKFTIPKLNFEESDYYELVNWLDFPRLEPQITCKLKENNLDEAITSGNMPDLEKYHCHTQAIERHIQVLIDASKAVCGKEFRDGYTRAKFESRKKMLKYTKKVNENYNLSVTYIELVI